MDKSFTEAAETTLIALRQRFPNLWINVSDFILFFKKIITIKKLENFGLSCKYKDCISKSKGDLI